LVGTFHEDDDAIKAAKHFVLAALEGNAFALLKLCKILETAPQFIADRSLAQDLRQFVLKKCTYDLRFDV
jgi:hypothetical protein